MGKGILANYQFNFTKSDIIKWIDYIERTFKVRIVQKKSSLFMRFIGSFLGFLHIFNKNITSKKVFLEDFTTTIYNTIYINFDIESLQMNSQNNFWIVYLLIHELTHTQQFKKHKIKMPLKYLFSNKARALYEAEAWSTHLILDLLYIKFNITPHKLNKYIDYVAQKAMTNYGISSSNANEIKKYMKNIMNECVKEDFQIPYIIKNSVLYFIKQNNKK